MKKLDLSYIDNIPKKTGIVAIDGSMESIALAIKYHWNINLLVFFSFGITDETERLENVRKVAKSLYIGLRVEEVDTKALSTPFNEVDALCDIAMKHNMYFIFTPHNRGSVENEKEWDSMVDSLIEQNDKILKDSNNKIMLAPPFLNSSLREVFRSVAMAQELNYAKLAYDKDEPKIKEALALAEESAYNTITGNF